MKKFDPISLARPNVLKLVPYVGEREAYTGKRAPVLLDSNENPYGEEALIRYPDNTFRELKARIATVKGVTAQQLVLGVGSDELIDMFVRAFCEPGRDNILISSPTFGMYHYYATLNNVGILDAPLTDDFQLDVAAIKAKVQPHTRALFICTPNNPTGNRMDPQAVRELVEWFDGFVVVDEAYIDFCPQYGLTAELARYPNLILLHTFSKAWGMAGLRMGVSLSSPEIADLLGRVRPPYNITTLSMQHLAQALQHPEKVAETARRIAANRVRLTEYLEQSRLFSRVCPSDTNFLLVYAERAHTIFQRAFEEGIIIRSFGPNKGRLTNALRINVGTEGENERLIALLARLETELQ
ncbi:MAG: histidinol-phosphate transaminase [Bacteroidetes bacterium]|nr:histidinol-phosphate transaminase [Bacteroidota bacterium]